LPGLILIAAFVAQAQTQADGMKAVEYENFATARRIFTQLIKNSASDAMNYYYLGVADCNMGKIDSARIIFNAGTEADPKSISNYIGLGRTYLEQNNAQQAQQYFDKAKSLTNQKDISLYLMMADAYTNSQHPDYNMSINLLNKAIEYTNKNAEVYWELGNAYEGLDKSGDAVNAYERATDLDPNMAKAYTRIGVIWRNAQRGEFSKQSFDKALEVDPNYPPAYRELAEFYHAVGQEAKATETYQKYLSMADQDDNTQFRYAQFLFLTKKYQDALNILNGQKQRMDVPVMYRMLGYANYEVGNYEEGLKNMRAFFVKSDPAKVISSDYEYLGKLELKTGDEADGFNDVAKSISIDSTRYYLEDTVATYLYKQKRYAEAGDIYARKIKEMPKNAALKDVAGTYFMAGKAYYFGHRFGSTDTVFMKLSQISPDWPISYLFRARCYLHLDSVDTAHSKAFPFYQMFIDKAHNDSSTLRKELAEAYQYLGNYNGFNRCYGASLYYFNKALALVDPNDPSVSDMNETVKAIKSQYKQLPGPPITVQKDSAGYEFGAIINGKEVTCLYSPAITGISITQEGDSQLSSMTKADIVKVGDRSLKNVPINTAADATRPISMGADVLNKMNIVFDYASSSLLQR